MSTHNICFHGEGEALLMSTNNICFHGEKGKYEYLYFWFKKSFSRAVCRFRATHKACMLVS